MATTLQIENVRICLEDRGNAVPLLLLHGFRDEYLSIARVGSRLAESLGTALIRLPGGHFTPLECPTEVSDALCAFLATLSPDEARRETLS